MREPERRDKGLPGGVTTDLLTSGPEREDGGERPGLLPWVWRVAGLLVVGLVAVVVGPHLLSSPGRPPASSPGSSALAAPPVRPTKARPVPLLSWAPRGPDVGSDVARAELAQLRAQRPDVDRLLWAGSLDGHDHVVVVSYHRNPDEAYAGSIEVAALRVRAASEIATAQSQTIAYVSEADALVGLAWLGEDQHTRLLVLGRRASTQVQVSLAIDYHPDGQVSRRWRDTRLLGGVLVTDLGRRVDPMVAVRPYRVSPGTNPSLVYVQGRPALPGVEDVVVSGVSSPSYAGPAAGELVDGLGQAGTGAFDLRTAGCRVLWSGRIAGGPHVNGRRITGRGALVLVRRPDGPVFQAFVYSDPRTGSSSGAVIAVRWSVGELLPYAFSAPEEGAPLLLVNPSGPGSVTLVPGAGQTRRVRFDDNGVARLSLDAAASIYGARVVVRDPAGRIVVSTQMPLPLDPFAGGVTYSMSSTRSARSAAESAVG